MFKLKPDPVAEEETERIQGLYFEWERRILWPANNAESNRHADLCVKTCHCRTKADEVHEWEDWALENMDKSLDELRWN